MQPFYYYVYYVNYRQRLFFSDFPVAFGSHHSPGGGTPIYGLYRYVPRDRVWFLRFSVLK